MTRQRRDDGLLAGVCSGAARRFGWNVWALRAPFVLFLLLKTVWAVVAYALLALAFHLLDGSRQHRRATGRLSSPELSDRAERIADLEQRFRDLESRNGP